MVPEAGLVWQVCVCVCVGGVVVVEGQMDDINEDLAGTMVPEAGLVLQVVVVAGGGCK